MSTDRRAGAALRIVAGPLTLDEARLLFQARALAQAGYYCEFDDWDGGADEAQHVCHLSEACPRPNWWSGEERRR